MGDSLLFFFLYLKNTAIIDNAADEEYTYCKI